MAVLTPQSNYLLACGCSHTRGTGVEPQDVYVQLVANALDLDLINLAQAGSSAPWVQDTLQKWLAQAPATPRLVIAQWPNPFRIAEIGSNGVCFSNVNCHTESFARKLQQDPDSFWQEWYTAICETNSHIDIPVINVCFESQNFVGHQRDRLLQQGIALYIDDKRPGHSWIFDSKAADGQHHSAKCHQAWSHRIMDIVNDLAVC